MSRCRIGCSKTGPGLRWRRGSKDCAPSTKNARQRDSGAYPGAATPLLFGRLSRRDAADVIRVGRAAQTVKPVIKRGAEQRHHLGDKVRRVVIGLPVL